VTNLPQPRRLELRLSACALLPQVTGRVGGSLQKSVAKGFERGETESPEAIMTGVLVSHGMRHYCAPIAFGVWLA
jgi:hypothetical protein